MNSLIAKGCAGLIWLFIAWPVAAQVVSDGVDVPELAAFDDVMLKFMQDHNIPDGQLAMTWKGRLVFARAYSNGSDNPPNIRTKFRIASVSKPLTATLLHRAQQDGLLSLDDTIDKYLDFTTLGNEMVDPRLQTVTVRNLLQHLAGFGSYTETGFDPSGGDAIVANATGRGFPITKLDIQKYMNGKSLTNPPGTTYTYSNYGYLLAGLVLESASGLSYGAYADSVLNPIGIYDARLARSQKHRMWENEAVVWSGKTRPTAMDNSGEILTPEYGGLTYENFDSFGGWSASAVELVRWLSSMDDPSHPDAILNQDSYDQMTALPDNWTGPYTDGDYFYSSGWQVRDYGSAGKTTWHDGSLPGTMSAATRFSNGWNFMAIFNRREENGGSAWRSELRTVINEAYAKVQSWPGHDLFDQSLAPEPEPITAQASGSWYDLTHDGEGFVVQVINPTTAVVYWFTYSKTGEQRWYFGIGTIKNHQIVLDTLYEASGGRFGPNFDPDEVNLAEVGSLVLSIYDNSSGKADYLLHGEAGYQQLSRLTQPFNGSDPMLAGDWRNGLWYDLTHDGEGFVVEVLPNQQILMFWFTYDNSGQPAWMIGIADASELESGVPVTLQRPDGGNFGVAFDPSLVQRHPNGSVTLKLGCQSGSDAGYSGGDAPYPDVRQVLQRLAGYVTSPCP